jgi:hypothetical protein
MLACGSGSDGTTVILRLAAYLRVTTHIRNVSVPIIATVFVCGPDDDGYTHHYTPQCVLLRACVEAVVRRRPDDRPETRSETKFPGAGRCGVRSTPAWRFSRRDARAQAAFVCRAAHARGVT